MEVSGKRAEFVTEPCEQCQIKGKCTQADGYCTDCDENMCTTCFQNHTTLKLCRNHVMSSLDQASLGGKDRARSNEKCKTHTSEFIKYYCPKHDMVTCGDCIVADHHGCKMEFISVLAKKFENSSEFKDIVKSLEKLEVENNESRKRLVNNRQKAFLDKALSEIKMFRKEINDHFDKVEREIVSEAYKRTNEIEDLMSKLEKMTSVADQDIADLRNNLDSKIIQGENLFIRTKEYKPKLSKVDGNIAYIRTNNVLKGFTFEQEKQLAGMIRSGIKLGCLRMDTAPEEAPAVVQKTQDPMEPRSPVLKWTAQKHVGAEQKFLPPANSRTNDIERFDYDEDIPDHDDLQNTIIQIMDLTGCTQDKAQIALFESKNDMDRAVNTLLEGGTDNSEWRESGKKKRKPKTEAPPPPVEYQWWVKPDASDQRKRYERYNQERNKDEKEIEYKTFKESWDYFRLRPRRNDNRPPKLVHGNGRPDKAGDRPEREVDKKDENNCDRDFDSRTGRGRGFGRRVGSRSPLD